MAMGKRRRHAKQAWMWLAANDLPRSAAHPFYTRLNQILDDNDFDRFVAELCQRFYAEDGRPGLPPGRYFRLLLIGYFEGLDAERAIAWRAADSFALREFLDWVLPEAPPDHSTISRTRRLIDLETHEYEYHSRNSQTVSRTCHRCFPASCSTSSQRRKQPVVSGAMAGEVSMKKHTVLFETVTRNLGLQPTADGVISLRG
jgi:hypothetical protein